MIKFETSKIDIFLTLTTIINWSGLNGQKRFLIGFMTKIFANSEGRVTLPNRKNFRKIGKGGGSFSILKFMLQVLGTLNTDDQAQEAGPSGWSVARGRICVMIFCKWPDPPDDQAQEAGPSRWSVARGRILWIIICKWPVSPHDHLQEAVFSKWSFARGGSSGW